MIPILYGSAKIHLKHITQEQINDLILLCGLSRDLYNLSIKRIKNHLETKNALPTFQELKADLVNEKEYQSIGKAYYAVIIEALSNYKKYFGIMDYKTRKSNGVIEKKNLKEIKPPSESKRAFPILITNPIRENNNIFFPATSQTPAIKIALPDTYKNLEIKRVHLLSKCNYRNWELIIEYPLKTAAQSDLNRNKTLGIDLGVNNFCTCITNEGQGFIIDGRRLKSIIQGYCKYQNKLSKFGKGTVRQASLQRKTGDRIRDYLNKSVMYLIHYCTQNHIGKIIVGWGLHFQTFQMGHKNNQIFSYFPYAVFIQALRTKCIQNGIMFFKTDESFTSQASALDLDPLPRFVTPKKPKFSGHRRYRGLYLTGDKRKINADLNGALNILRKGNAVTDDEIIRLSGRGLAEPQRINIYSLKSRPASQINKQIEVESKWRKKT